MNVSNLPASTAEIKVPARIIDQIIGQERAVEVVKLAALHRRFLLIVGEPGTGKSLLGQAMAELLPAEQLEDIIAHPNFEQPVLPRITRHPAGEGRAVIEKYSAAYRARFVSERYLLAVGIFAAILIASYYSTKEQNPYYLLFGICFSIALFVCRRILIPSVRRGVPKMLVCNEQPRTSPFVDATGCQAGALLGDVRHDPYQSGGHETPPHELLEPGAIHRAHRGVLFIDEVSTLSMESQQSLLSAIQEKELPISGRSTGSSGAMVRSDPVPCDFLLVLSGNEEDIEKMHPALRSRIRGYGYEIYTRSTIEDSPANSEKLTQFIAQEVKRDGKIPHASVPGIDAILEEARLRAGSSGGLTARFRELGGLIRIAGDLAAQESSTFIEPRHVKHARLLACSLEEQKREQLRASDEEPITGRVIQRKEECIQYRS